MENSNGARFVRVSSPTHHQALVSGLWHFLLTKHGVDVDFRWGNSTVRAHRLVAEVFLSPDKLYRAGSGDVDSASLDLLLEFLYKGAIDVRKDQLDHLLDVARRVDFPMLADAVQSSIGPRPALGRSHPVVGARASATIGSARQVRSDRPKQLQQHYRCAAPDPVRRAEMPDPLPVGSEETVVTFSQWSVPSVGKAELLEPKSEPLSETEELDQRDESPDDHEGLASDGWTAEIGEPGFREVPCTSKPGLGLRSIPGRILPSASPERRVWNLPAVAAAAGGCGVCGRALSGRPCACCWTSTANSGSDRRPLVCNICHRVFNRRDHLFSHMMKQHDTYQDSCPLCPFTSDRRGDVGLHVEDAHPGVRLFACETCGFNSISRTNLDRHRRTHTGEKPFKCDVCGQVFGHRSSYKKHMQRHVSDDKPYECPVCHQAFNKLFNFKMHLKRVHEDVSCPLCRHAASSRRELRQHLKSAHSTTEET